MIKPGISSSPQLSVGRNFVSVADVPEVPALSQATCDNTPGKPSPIANTVSKAMATLHADDSSLSLMR
jgi:hypothetical protein